ncbi:hypothetical protein EVAR_49337_1 [Eumeta japonica]|uniref:Uncharacterized protein n=1 Tax=Eumeta variegata TaxID=151549 RepID=A0A4C1XWG8_EUMVA|nr:hypothetical protein EVAR_49337_1 [Eumeta japonica]
MTHYRVPPKPSVRAKVQNERSLFHAIGRCVRVEERQRPHTTYTILQYLSRLIKAKRKGLLALPAEMKLGDSTASADENERDVVSVKRVGKTRRTDSRDSKHLRPLVTRLARRAYHDLVEANCWWWRACGVALLRLDWGFRLVNVLYTTMKGLRDLIDRSSISFPLTWKLKAFFRGPGPVFANIEAQPLL